MLSSLDQKQDRSIGLQGGKKDAKCQGNFVQTRGVGGGLAGDKDALWLHHFQQVAAVGAGAEAGEQTAQGIGGFPVSSQQLLHVPRRHGHLKNGGIRTAPA